jgi:lipopolysaccharide transport system permease protein
MQQTIIRANQPWWRIPWRELADYRDLLWLLVVRDFSAVYKQSILGPLWFIVQPLATTIVFTVIFGHIAKIGTDGIPPMLFYMAGMVLWSYFQGVMNGVAGSLIGNAGVLGKVYFPRLILPFSMVISNLAQFGLNLLVFLIFYLYFFMSSVTTIHPNVWMAVLPLLILQTAVVGLGVGLWMSALTTKYRDLRFALPFLSQLWMYATPVVYPASLVVSPGWNIGMAINPMAGLVEAFRFMFFGIGRADWLYLGIGIASGWILLLTGLIMFNRVQRTFVDTI